MGLACGLQVLGSPTAGVCGVSLLRVTKLLSAFSKRLWEVDVLNNSVAFAICIRGVTKSATHQLTGRTGGLIFRMLPGNLAVGFPLLLMGLMQLNFM